MTQTFVKDVTLDTARRTLKNKHDIKVTKAELCEFLQDPKATHIGKDDIERFAQARKGEAEADDVHPAASDAPAEPAPEQPQEEAPPADEPTKPLREAVAMLVEKGAEGLTVELAIEFLGKSAPDDGITTDEFKSLITEYRTKVAEGAEVSIQPKRAGRFAKQARKRRQRSKTATPRDWEIAKKFWADVQKVWAYTEPKPARVEKRGMMGFRDALVPDRIIEMPLIQFREEKGKGILNTLDDKTVAEMVADIMAMSLWSETGTYCGQPMRTHHEGLVRQVLEGKRRPPLIRFTRGQLKELGLENAKPFIFYDEHPACSNANCLVDMMSVVEAEFEGPETQAKRIKRVVRYREELLKVINPETGKTRVQLIMESERVWDPGLRKMRPLNRKEVVDRMKAIDEHLNKYEEVS